MSGTPADRAPIGRLLVERGVAGVAAVEEAARAPGEDGRLCSTLLDSGACDEGDLAATLAEHLGIPGVDLSRTVIDLAAVALVPQDVAETDLLLPLQIEENRVHVVVDSPQRAARSLDEVRFVTGREVTVYVAVLSSLRRAMAGCYAARARGSGTWRGVAATAPGPSIAVRAPPSVPSTSAMIPVYGPTRRPVPSAEPRPPAAPSHSPAGHVRPPVTASGRGRWILVVDDEDAIRLLVEKALRHHGYDVETAVDGLEALEKLQKRRFDLVLLDAMLPRMHGFDVARRIRSVPALRQMRVIMMTAVYRGWRFAQDTRQAYGTHDYIEKPFRIDDLLRRIDAALATSAPAIDARALDALVERGRTALTEGRLDEAAAAFEEAVALDADSADAHQGLGEVLRQRGDAFRAMTELERAIELKPDQLDAVRVLGALYLQKGFRAKAAEAFERGIAATSDPRQRDQLRRELIRLL